MSEELQQIEQPSNDELETTAPAEESPVESNEPESNADQETDNLEQHLAQFDAMATAQAGEQQQPAQEPALQPEQATEVGDVNNAAPIINNGPVDNRLDEVYANYEQNQKRQVREDIDKTVGTVREASPVLKSLPDYVIEGAINKLADTDPRIAKAFQMRKVDPKLWENTLASLSKRMTRDFSSKPDSDASSDIAAVRASVNSQSGGTVDAGPSDDDIANMSPQQFNQHKISTGLA